MLFYFYYTGRTWADISKKNGWFQGLGTTYSGGTKKPVEMANINGCSFMKQKYETKIAGFVIMERTVELVYFTLLFSL